MREHNSCSDLVSCCWCYKFAFPAIVHLCVCVGWLAPHMPANEQCNEWSEQNERTYSSVLHFTDNIFFSTTLMFFLRNKYAWHRIELIETYIGIFQVGWMHWEKRDPNKKQFYNLKIISALHWQYNLRGRILAIEEYKIRWGLLYSKKVFRTSVFQRRPWELQFFIGDLEVFHSL